MKSIFSRFALSVPSRPQSALGGDEIPPGQFRGGDEIPPGQFRGGDEIPPGQFRRAR